MSRVKVRYFVEKKQKGHTLYYWQPSKALRAAGFPTRRLAEGSNDRGEALKEAEALNRELDAWRGGKNAIPSRAGTIPWLIGQYMENEAFTGISPETQRSYQRRMRVIELWSERAGHPPIKTIDRKAAKAFHRALLKGTAPLPPRLGSGGAPVKDPELAAHRRAADVMGMCRILWSFAHDEGEVSGVNPFAAMRTKGSPPRDQVWTDQQIDAVVAASEVFEPILDKNSIAVQQKAALAAELAMTLPTESDLRDARFAEFQQLVNGLLARHNGSPGRLARELDIPRSTLSYWLSGQNVPSPAMLEKLRSLAGTEATSDAVDHTPVAHYGSRRERTAAAMIGGISPTTVRLAIRRMRKDPEAHERAKAGLLTPIQGSARKEACCSVGLAVRIGANTAQRLGDILRMTWNQYDGTRIRLKQRKTGAFLDIPVTEDLKAALDAAPRLSPVIVVDEYTGKPWQVGPFERTFRKIKLSAGIPDDLQFRDLRRTATVRLAEAECAPPLIAAIGGWSMTSLMKMLDIYMPRNTAMARQAIAKLEEYRRTQREQRSSKLEG
jgi:integrase